MPARNATPTPMSELASVVASAAADPKGFAARLQEYDEHKSESQTAEAAARAAKAEAERVIAAQVEERQRLDAGWADLRQEQAESLEIAKELERRERDVIPREQACADREVALQEREAALVQARTEAIEAFKRLVGAT